MDRIEIGKLSAAYDVRRLGLADAPVVYAFCKADTQYYARCGAEVTLALAPAAGSSRRRWLPCRRRAWGWTSSGLTGRGASGVRTLRRCSAPTPEPWSVPTPPT